MNEAILPAMVAAVGGTALGGTILVHEARAESAMRTSRVRLAITFPASADAIYAKAALSALSGTDPRLEYVFELDASNDGVRYFMLVPSAARVSVLAMLPIPGVEVGASRQLVVPRHVPGKGLRLLVGRDSVGNASNEVLGSGAHLHYRVDDRRSPCHAIGERARRAGCRWCGFVRRGAAHQCVHGPLVVTPGTRSKVFTK
jgi:hypothetical protein